MDVLFFHVRLFQIFGNQRFGDGRDRFMDGVWGRGGTPGMVETTTLRVGVPVVRSLWYGVSGVLGHIFFF